MQFHALMNGPCGSFNVTVEARSYADAAAYLEDQYEESSPVEIETNTDAQNRENAVWESLK